MTDRPGHLPAAERAARNARIHAARIAGAPWADIARREGVSLRTASRAYEEHRAALAARSAGAPVGVEPDALVREVVDGLREAAADLRRLARAADNDSARVGAARARAAVLRDLLLEDVSALLVVLHALEVLANDLR